MLILIVLKVVFALSPEKVADAVLLAPSQVDAGSMIQPRFELRGASGDSLGVLGSVRIRLHDEHGEQLLTGVGLYQPMASCPPSLSYWNAGKQVMLEVVDTITGRIAQATMSVNAQRQAPVGVADPVTVYRPDQIQSYLKKHTSLNIVVDAGRLQWNKEGVVSLSTPNDQLARDKRWAAVLQRTLQSKGVSAKILGSRTKLSASNFGLILGPEMLERVRAGPRLKSELMAQSSCRRDR